MVSDHISDMIMRLKNAGEAEKESVVLPYSNFKLAVLEVLEKEGYIKSHAKKGKKVSKLIEVEIAYVDGKPRIQGVERVSHLSKRVYKNVKSIHSVRQGYGMLVLTTPKGILTDKQARKEKVGGEALFKIW